MIKRADDRDRAGDDTARRIREEIVLRPARRAALFCVLVAAALTGTAVANGGDESPVSPGFEIRAEILR